MPSNRKIRVFAGPNGSGKSSLFQEFSKTYKTGVFINADEFEKQLALGGLIDLNEIGIHATESDLDYFKTLDSTKSLLQKAAKENQPITISIKENFIVDSSKSTHSYEGAFIASFIRYLLIKQQKSFSFETVMSHTSKLNEIEAIVAKGYRSYLYFVCTDSPEVNVSRVNNRVEKGGHYVSDEKIIERYYRTLSLLHQVIPLCYRAYLFDNSGKQLQLVAEVYNNAMELKTNTPPNWFIQYVLPYYSG
jgi:predicted ABC-type ATPase